MNKRLGLMLGFGMLAGMAFLGFLTWVIVGSIRQEGDRTRQAMDEATSSLPANQLDDSLGTAIEKGSDAAERVLGGLSEAAKTAKDQDPGDIIGGFFDLGQTVAKELDSAAQKLLKIDTAEEIKYGQELHAQIRAEQSLSSDTKSIERIKRLAQPYLDARKNKRIDYTFSVIDDPQVNAFAHLGGYIYVNKGLLDFVESDEELQFVIGHEIGHVDLGHCAEQLTYTARAAEVAGEAGATLAQLGYQAIALGYSEDKEFESDAYAYRHLKSIRPAAISFLQRLADLELSDDSHGEDEFGVPGLDAIAMELDNHFKTHPPTTERIDRLKALQ